MFTIEDTGDSEPLAIVRGGSSDGEIIYTKTNNTVKKENPSMIRVTPKISVIDGKFELVPNPKARVVYIAGPSGSGKSTFASQYIANYKAIHPKCKFYLFSKLTDDAVLDKLKPIRIKLDESLVSDPIEIEEVEKGSIICFDDCDNIHDRRVQAALDKFKEQVLELGRHRDIQCVNTSHLINPNARSIARVILNESHCYVFFPQSGSIAQIKYTLKTQFGLSDKQCKKVCSVDSRWICINKLYPQTLLTQTCATFLKDLEV